MTNEELKPVDLKQLATLMRRAIYSAFDATLINNAPPVTRNFFERTRNPKVGDLVIETTTVYGMRHANATDLDGIGILEEIAWEPVIFGDPDFVWDEKVEGEPHPTEKCFYIRTFDGRRFRWTNANIIAAVSDPRIF